MISIQGEHICKVDSKGRFLLPNGIKIQLNEAIDKGFIIKKSIFEECLELYPISNWEQLIQKISSKLNRFIKKHNDFLRAFNSGLKELNIDGNGRILIPKDLIQYAQISSDIVLTAKMDCIEIWDKVKYDSAIYQTQLNISELAEDILGNIDLNN